MHSHHAYRNRPEIALDRIAMNPAFTAVAPHASRSEKYQMIPTIEVVEEMVNKGFKPVDVQVSGVRDVARRGYQKHMVRFRNPNLTTGEEELDVVLINSHDGTTAYKVMAGIYRLVCSNGLMVGTDICGFSVKHMGFNPQDVIDASFKVVDQAEGIMAHVAEFKAIELAPEERLALGTAAGQLLYPDNTRPDARQLTYSHRNVDQDHLWGAYNAIQENWSKGRTNYRGGNGRYRKNRAPKAIDKQTGLNAALWTLTQRMADIKTGRPVQAVETAA